MTPQIEKILAEIVEKLKREYQPEKIILYGSYAYGTPTRHSDIGMRKRISHWSLAHRHALWRHFAKVC